MREQKRAAQYLPQNAQSASENTREKAVEADEAVSGVILVEKDICNKCYLSTYRVMPRVETRSPLNGQCEDCGEPSAYRVTVRGASES